MWRRDRLLLIYKHTLMSLNIHIELPLVEICMLVEVGLIVIKIT